MPDARVSSASLAAPAAATPERSPLTSAAKTGTPAREKPSAITCKVTVFPVPVAPATRPWRLERRSNSVSSTLPLPTRMSSATARAPNYRVRSLKRPLRLVHAGKTRLLGGPLYGDAAGLQPLQYAALAQQRSHIDQCDGLARLIQCRVDGGNISGDIASIDIVEFLHRPHQAIAQTPFAVMGLDRLDIADRPGARGRVGMTQRPGHIFQGLGQAGVLLGRRQPENLTHSIHGREIGHRPVGNALAAGQILDGVARLTKRE